MHSDGFVSRQLKTYATASHNRPIQISCCIFFVTILMTVIVVAAGLFEVTQENGKVRPIARSAWDPDQLAPWFV